MLYEGALRILEEPEISVIVDACDLSTFEREFVERADGIHPMDLSAVAAILGSW